MNIITLIGHTVTHQGYGIGTIISVEAKRITIEFDSVGLKNLQFPQVFLKLLTLDDANLQEEVLADARKLEAEKENKRKEEEAQRRLQREKQEVERLAAIASAAVSAGKQARSASAATHLARDKEPVKMYGDGVIGPETAFYTHADVLNTLFGYHYKHYQKASKDLGNGYKVWFPNIATRVGDQYLSSDNYWGWVNILSDSGDTVTQIDNAAYTNRGTGGPDKNKCFIFARFDHDKRYSFIGLFGPARREINKTIRTRIGTIVDVKNFRILQ